MLMNGKYDGFGADDEWVMPDPGAEYEPPREEYVTPTPEPAPDPEYTNYVELRPDDEYTGNDWKPAGDDSAAACPSGDYSSCANSYAKKYGGNSSDWMGAVKGTVSDVKGIAGLFDGGGNQQGITQYYPSTFPLPNCGVPSSKYICKATETCGQCLYRSVASGFLVPSYTGPAYDANIGATVGTPIATAAPLPIALRSSGAIARFTQLADRGLVIGSKGGGVSSGSTPTSTAGSSNAGLLMVAAAAAFFLFKR
jgi:hypothetical protein